jgi:hypothetical protein
VLAVDLDLALGWGECGSFLRLVGEVAMGDHEGPLKVVALREMVLSHRRTAQGDELCRPHCVRLVQCVPLHLVVPAAQTACVGNTSGMICSM